MMTATLSSRRPAAHPAPRLPDDQCGFRESPSFRTFKDQRPGASPAPAGECGFGKSGSDLPLFPSVLLATSHEPLATNFTQVLDFSLFLLISPLQIRNWKSKIGNGIKPLII